MSEERRGRPVGSGMIDGEDLVGSTKGRLRVERTEHREGRWWYFCTCLEDGKQIWLRRDALLRAGPRTSCGCLRRKNRSGYLRRRYVY